MGAQACVLADVMDWGLQKANSEMEIGVQEVFRECFGVIPYGRERRKQDWVEEKPGSDAVSSKAQPIPQGTLKPGWPFRVVLSWGEGARLLELSGDLPLDVDCEKGM